MKLRVLMVSTLMLLSACETTNTDRGVLLGAAAGGILGNQVGGGSGQAIATGAGMFVGAAAGKAVGARMDETDRLRMEQAQIQSLEYGRVGDATNWSNPDTGSSGSISPVSTYQNAAGQYCREFQQEVTVGGQPEQLFGTACREADGSWRIVGG